MRIAGAETSRPDAIERVRAYAKRYYNTLRIFDGIGANVSDDSPNKVTLGDVGRLVVINAGLRANDVPKLLAVDAFDAFEQVPFDARLEDCEPGTPLWDAASDLYEKFRASGIGPAKRSKALHSKRPSLYFINDSVTRARYKDVADRVAREADYKTSGYWEAARNDLLQAEFKEFMNDVADITVLEIEGQPTLADLSAVRVLDILAWNS